MFDKYKFLKKYCWLFIYSSCARKLYRKYLDDEILKMSVNELNNIISTKIKDGYCICILPASLGDTLLFYEYKSNIEKQHNVKLFSVVRTSQRCVPYLCNTSEYLVVDDLSDILKIKKTKELYPKAKTLFDIAALSPNITRGKYFVAHMDFIKQKQNFKPKNINQNIFRQLCCYLYDLKNYTKYSDVINSKPEQKFILLAPESALKVKTNAISPNFWIKIAKYYKDNGYTVLYNSVNKIGYLEEYAIWLDCSLYSCIIIAKGVEKVISIRSGLCDLLHFLGNKLYIVYPEKVLSHNYFSLNSMYNRNDINEFIMKEEDKDAIINQICC